MRRAVVVGAITGALIGVGTAAIAAAITLTTASALGAGLVNVNPPCDTSYSIDLSAPAWNPSTSAYESSGFDIDGITTSGACATSLVRVNVLDASQVSLADALTVAANGTYTLSTPVDVAAVASIASVIYEA